MKMKKHMIILSLFMILLCCISAVNAADNNTDTLEITQNQDTISIDNAQETLSDSNDKAPSNIKITASSITYGEDLNVTVKLPSDVSRRANVSVGDESKLISLTDGKATAVFTDLNAGKYTIFASYGGDANYLPSNASKTVSVKKADAGITINADSIDYGETLSVTLTAAKDITKRINVTIENQSKLVSLKNGEAMVKFTGLTVGKYTVTATYAGDKNYLKSEAQKSVTVNKAPATIKFTTKSVDYGEDLAVTVKLPKDVTKRALVSIGNESKYASLKDGEGSVKFTGLKAGKYTIEATYAGDANYKPSNATKAVTVKKADADITINADSIDYGETLSVTVTAPKDITKRINLTLDSQSKLVSLKNGEATLKFKNLNAGTYAITAAYAGDANYKKSQAQKSVTVNKATATIKLTANSISYGEDLTVSVKLPKDVTKRVLVTAGDQSKYATLTNGQGSVKFTDLNAGKYTVTATYEGDANYLKSDANKTVYVKKNFDIILYTDHWVDEIENYAVTDTIKHGEFGYANIFLPADISRRVNITIGNESYMYSVSYDNDSEIFFPAGVADESVDTSNLASIYICLDYLDAGIYNITATYNGDEIYAKSQATTQLTVTKEKEYIYISSGVIYPGDKIYVYVPFDIDYLNVTINGNTQTISRNEYAEMAIETEGLEEGNYEITASYAGDKNYEKSSKTADISIERCYLEGVMAVYTLVYDEDIESWIVTDDLHYGEPFCINIYAPEDLRENLRVSLGDLEYTLPANDDGFYEIQITDLEYGDYYLMVSYPGDNKYSSAQLITPIYIS